MENQHRHIEGYRELRAEEIASMNGIKAKAEEVGALIEKLRDQGADPRWLAIGQTNLQQGFMAITRAIAKPTTF